MSNNQVEGKELLDVEWVALIMLARKMGFTVKDIRNTLNTLQPSDRTPESVKDEVI